MKLLKSTQQKSEKSGLLSSSCEAPCVAVRTYNPVRYLGGGAFATVQLGRYSVPVCCGLFTRQQPCAIKSNRLSKHYHLIEAENQIMELIQAVCGAHPNIIQRLSFIPELPYLVLEYCQGGNLEAYCFSTNKTVPLIWFLQLASSLSTLHQAGFFHCDIKPANILIQMTSSGPVVKLSDFGLALRADQLTRPLSGLRGTPSYLAPEMISGQCKGYDKADMWSLGVVFYEMILRQRLFNDTPLVCFSIVLTMQASHQRFFNNRYAFGPLQLHRLYSVVPRLLEEQAAHRDSALQCHVSVANALNKVAHIV